LGIVNTPTEIVDWLREKVEDHRWCGVKAQRAVTHRWRRHLGGRVMSAGLTLSIAPSDDFAFGVDATGVDIEYIAAVRNAVLTVLLSQSWAPILRCTVTASSFQVHDTESTYAAFFSVAEEATRQLLGVVPGYAHNIDW
jgi:hypothetical protein